MLIIFERAYPVEEHDAAGTHAGFLWEIANMGEYVCILVHMPSQHPGDSGEGVMLTTRFLDHWYDAETITANARGHDSRLATLSGIIERDTEGALCVEARGFYDESLHIPPQEPDSYWRRPKYPFRGFTYAMTLCCKLCEFAVVCQEEASRGQYAD